MWQLLRTARTLDAERRQVLRESVDTGTNEDESGIGRVWAAGFHHVTARSWQAFLKLRTVYFFCFPFIFFGPR
jgi:hypothetical protein